MLEQIELGQLPEKLKEAVQTTEQSLNRFSSSPCEIISMAKIDLDRPEAPGLKKKLYRVIFLVANTFEILEQVTDDGFNLGVSEAMLTIGTVKEIMEKAPKWTGLKSEVV
ncbi:hypothetical protein SDC9_170428 [bioreactor metagenome]|uniref:Uncharacterized protein n=1 Tax=bioreactor metagenome TaxID=1076179 RepID=A0A645GH24_9ZZZZ